LTARITDGLAFKVPKADMDGLKHALRDLDDKLKKKIIRQAARQSQRVHILPFIRRATPDGSGRKSRGRSLYTAGLRNNAFSAGAYGGRSTGRARRSWKVGSMKRSRRISGANTVVYDKATTFYLKFLEKGRTFNMFLPMRKWQRVSAARKKDLWIEGRHVFKKTAERRGQIAKNSMIRGIWQRIEKHVAKNRTITRGR